jgi:hypothetical protein
MSTSTIVIPGAPAFMVGWSCRRCGHTGGWAKAKIPVTPDWSEPMMRALLDDCRRKVVQIHLRGQGCVATVEDIALHRLKDDPQRVVGVI